MCPSPRSPEIARVPYLTLFVVCACAYLLMAPGRIIYPDDEIAYQTTRSLWQQGDLSISGIPTLAGKIARQTPGTFGWAEGTDGKRYGFFGYGLSYLTAPLYGLAKASTGVVPPDWTQALERHQFYFHLRSFQQDWLRLVVSLTNSLLTPIAVCLLVCWLIEVGVAAGAALATGLSYGLATTAWPYSGTYLSEPLSSICLLAGAICVARFRREQRAGQAGFAWLWGAALMLGVSTHVHLLNALAAPAFALYAALPSLRAGSFWQLRWGWFAAAAIGLCFIALLLWQNEARFADPLETGRYGNYAYWRWPFEPLAAYLVGPGRSIALYSPPIALGLFAWRRTRARAGDELWFALALVALRAGFAATRTDWFGGWGIGPRYLVPMVPFLLLPLAFLLERWGRMSTRMRATVVLTLAGSALLQAHLSAHSIFRWMFLVMMKGGVPEYMWDSHWNPMASPIVGFFGLEWDMLSLGALRLAAAGASGLAWIFAGILALGIVAAWRLARSLEQLPLDEGPVTQPGDTDR